MHLSVPLGIPTTRKYGEIYAVIEMNGGANLVLTSIDDADALIAAACEAKRLLEPPVPACPSVAPFTGRACTETGEHECHRSGMITWTDKDPAPAVASRDGLCEYCQVEPATEGKWCAECAPAVELATKPAPVTVGSEPVAVTA